MKHRSVVIIGAGIAGLSLARFLERDGHRVTLIERAKDFSAQGHSIGFRGIGFQVMDLLGLRERIERTGRGYRASVSRTLRGGRRLRETLYSDHAKTVGGNTTTQRGQLHRALAENLPDAIDLRFGLRPTAIAQDAERVDVTLSNGERLRGDILAGCDGANSEIRRLVAPEVEFRDFGGVYVGMTVTVDHGQPVCDANAYWGRGRLAALFPVDAHAMAVVVYQHDDFGPTPDSNDPVAWRDYFARSYADAAEPVRRVLAALKPGDEIFHDRIRQVPPRLAARGRVALVGDAGYCPTFFAGNGAAVAAVGAYCLARSLRLEDDDAAALKAYEARILPFAAGYQASAQRMRDTLLERSPLKTALRELGMRFMPASVFTRNQARQYRAEAKLSDVE
jgi:2-polyprenyl-6-methoxyphenol hydroxylase-like FAD-dependent oxidoreductase